MYYTNLRISYELFCKVKQVNIKIGDQAILRYLHFNVNFVIKFYVFFVYKFYFINSIEY